MDGAGVVAGVVAGVETTDETADHSVEALLAMEDLKDEGMVVVVRNEDDDELEGRPASLTSRAPVLCLPKAK